MLKKQLDEKVSVGGGATGVSEVPVPADKSATLPASKLGNGEPMRKIDDPNNPGVEDTSSENNTKTTKDNASANKATLNMKPSSAQAGQTYSFTPNSVKEDVEVLFSGEELSEEFRTKATAIFEAAVALRVSEQVTAIEEQFQASLQEQQEEFEQQLTKQVEAYMDYVVEQWMEENQVAIEHSLRTEITESFIGKLRDLFAENYIDIPDEKVDVLGEMAAKVEELEQKLDGLINENADLKQQVHAGEREKIVAAVSEGLAATQVEKLMALAEGVDFDTPGNFEKKLQIVKENYFPTSKEVKTLTEELITEEVGDEEGRQPTATGPMANYVSAISRTLKK